MPFGKRQRRWFLALGIVFGVLLVLCLALPVWFPWLLSPLASRQGIHYGRYEREGYRRFAVYQASFTNGNVRVQAERLEALTPSAWLWRALSGKGAGPWVRVDGWKLELSPGTNQPVQPRQAPSAYRSVEEVAQTLPRIERWLPAATLSNGTIQAEQNLIEVPAATWSRGKIWAKASFRDQQGTVSARIGKAFPYELQFQSDTLRLQATAQLVTNAQGMVLRSRSMWWSNRVDLQAEFGREGLLPVRAEVQVPNLRLAPQWLGLEDYYRDIRGSVAGSWEEDHFALSLNAAARPLARETNIPPIQAEFRAQGGTNGATIETVNIHSPFLEATLSRPLTLQFARPWITGPATLTVSADLSRQTWTPWSGKLKGSVEVEPGADLYPRGQFNLTAAETGVAELKARTGVVQGSFVWPWLELKQAEALFEDGSRAVGRGRFDVTNRVLAEAHVELTGALPNRWLPAGYQIDSCTVAVDANGPVNALGHHGRLTATNVIVPGLRPAQVTTEWQATNLVFAPAKVDVGIGASAISAEGNVTPGKTQVEVALRQLSMQTAGTNLLSLRQPARIRFAAAKHWKLETELLDLAGDNRRLQVEATMNWPEQARGHVLVTNVHSELLREFITNTVEPITVERLETGFGWTNGPIRFGLDLAASGLARTDFPIHAAAQLAGDGHEIIITNLAITSRTSAVTTISGRLPVSVSLVATNRVNIDSHASLELNAMMTPHAIVWEKLSQLTGVSLLDPECRVALVGTWEKPAGNVHLRSGQVRFLKAQREVPSFENLHLEMELDRELARITEAGVLVQNQPVALTGEFPLGQGFWTGLREKRLPRWENARAHLTIQEAQLAAFAPLLPQVLSPQGELDLDLSLVPGGKLDGTLKLEHARTRPLGNLGPIRDIAMEMKFVERALELQVARADIGGAAVQANGRADLADGRWLQGQVPPFQFVLRGTNVPLSRQPESIIRSDLDLSVIRTNDQPPLISGTLNLRDSFYLRDVRDLVPAKVSAPSKRPPYFSIDAPGFGDWRLAARVTGTRFLRVRSTLFNGEVSANLRLEGTLREPVALGDLKIDSGNVRFPFASLAVKQGFVTLSSSNPYRPELQLQAESKRLGYELRMEVTGPVDQPVVQFSSTPPLNSEQIVLMLTAGEVPGGTLSLTPQQKAQTVAVFFGRDLLTRLGLGDESEERLTFQSGEQVSEQGRPTYNIEYKLTDRWALVGEYDRFNAFNAGLKWRVYSK